MFYGVVFAFTQGLRCIKHEYGKMNHRQLKKILKPIKESLDNGEPKQIEKDNLDIAKSTLIISRVSVVRQFES